MILNILITLIGLYLFVITYFHFKYPELRWNWDDISTENISFPLSFIWGTATASHQVEGNCQNNWSEFDRRYGKGGFAITRLVAIAGGFTTLERAKEIEEFFKAHPAPSAAITIQQTLERIKLNHAWLHHNRSGLSEWFSRK